MSTRTKGPSRPRSQSAIGLEPRECEISALDGEAPRVAVEGRELPAELVDEAVNRARVRSAVGPLAGGGRLSDAVIDELLAGASSEEEIVGPGGLLARLTKRLVERAMEVELTDHLGYEPHAEPPGGTGNTRNGSTPKTLITDHG